ncbi:hypothetical protein [Bradyrhizobium australafricanum]|uniref:hypothetical protein n=1 Tax=Bradyrhizobium australafricanum TaxID=2821406 RepID=UPI001CE385F4|nr:hypothetical protein [Bradyrhizobium australafricanum]MCA6104757.1 hypothetical protein [Bradyrhizobium australafricanum]
MVMKKTPERVDDGARPESEAQKIESEKRSDLVEIAKQGGEFKKHYGKWWGGFLLLSLANKASGRRPFLLGGLLSLVTVAGGLVLKYGLPTFG